MNDLDLHVAVCPRCALGYFTGPDGGLCPDCRTPLELIPKGNLK